MLTAAYLNNRTPHAAFNNETPYKRLYGKDATLGHFRTIGARAIRAGGDTRQEAGPTCLGREARGLQHG